MCGVLEICQECLMARAQSALWEGRGTPEVSKGRQGLPHTGPHLLTGLEPVALER